MPYFFLLLAILQSARTVCLLSVGLYLNDPYCAANGSSYPVGEVGFHGSEFTHHLFKIQITILACLA